MEAMILAAGLGTRLGSITQDRPKALVEVAGRPLLGWVIERLAAAGATRIIINTHQHEEQIRAFVRESAPTDVSFVFSPEPDGPYETGGGLFGAAPLFQEEGPFLLHNVDILSTIPLRDMLARHRRNRATKGKRVVASLAVQERDSRRALLFDEQGLMGWESAAGEGSPGGSSRVREPVGNVQRWAFTGIHVVEPAIFGLSRRTGAFSVITLYLELAAQGWTVEAVNMSREVWFDVGTPARLAEAQAHYLRGS